MNELLATEWCSFVVIALARASAVVVCTQTVDGGIGNVSNSSG